MRLYFPVDLTGNVNMIEKFVLGGTGTGTSRSLARRANLCTIKSSYYIDQTLCRQSRAGSG